MPLVPQNIHNQHDNENAIYYLTWHKIFYAFNTQNWNINDIVIRMDTLGLLCERISALRDLESSIDFMSQYIFKS
jgi:hypothetical protein